MTTFAPALSNRYFLRTAEWLRSLLLVISGSLLIAILVQESFSPRVAK